LGLKIFKGQEKIKCLVLASFFHCTDKPQEEMILLIAFEALLLFYENCDDGLCSVPNKRVFFHKIEKRAILNALLPKW